MPVVIKADEKDVAKVVLLPGDPLRAQYIAKNFLSDSILYTHERMMLGYTGYYKGFKVSVQTTGMGVPSFSIIAEELNMLNVKSLIRVGTAGAIDPQLKPSDLVVATSAHITSPLWASQFDYGNFSPTPDFNIINMILSKSKKIKKRAYFGSVLTSIFLYGETEEILKKFFNYNTLAVEMETYALFAIANKYKIKSASVLTISDTLFKEKDKKLIHNVKWANKETIKKGVNDMTELVLETISDNYSYFIN